MAQKQKLLEDYLKRQVEAMCVNNIIKLLNPSVLQTYPNWPTGIPSNLLFENYLKGKEKKKKGLKKETDLNQNEGIVVGKRSSRFQGSYNLDQIESSDDDLNSKKSKKVIKKNGINEITPEKEEITEANENEVPEDSNNTSQKAKNRTCTLSETSDDDSSSSENSVELKKKRFDDLLKLKEIPISKGIPTTAKVISKKPLKLSKHVNNDSVRHTENSKIPVSNLELVKEAFKNGDFDQCMAKYVSSYKEKIKEIPPSLKPIIIEPPDHDPSKRFTNKKKKSEELSIMPQVVVPREERALPQIEIFATNDDDIHDLEKVHDQYLNGSDSDSSSLGKLEICNHCESEEDQSESQSEETSGSNDAEKKLENGLELEDDEISIGDDVNLSDLVDGEEETPKEPKKVNKNENFEIYTEINDLHLKIGRIKVKQTEKEQASDFDAATKKVSEYAVDPVTDNVLLDAFHGICPGFLEEDCRVPNCRRRHAYVSVEDFLKYYMSVSSTTRNQIYKTTLRFPKLFKSYMPAFTETAINFNDLSMLSSIVKDCCAHARTVGCLKTVLDLTLHRKYFDQQQAIKFIIKNHQDSISVRDVILNMIVDSGPLITQFTYYIANVMTLQTISPQIFNKILHSCLCWYNPMFPKICYNQYLTAPQSFVDELDKKTANRFIDLLRFQKKVQINRPSKLEGLCSKMIQFYPHKTAEIRKIMQKYKNKLA